LSTFPTKALPVLKNFDAKNYNKIWERTVNRSREQIMGDNSFNNEMKKMVK